MSLNSNNHIKIGSSSLNSISVKDFSIGVRGGADYGPTSISGFYNGITPPIGGYTIYVEKSSQGPSIHVPRTDEECLYYLNKYGANATNISDALTWADSQNNILVRTSEYQLSDLTGGGGAPTITLNGSSFNAGDTMTFTFDYFPPNQTLYVWLDGHVYSYDYFTVPIIDGTTTITTDGNGHTTFSMTLIGSQAGGTFNMYFAPALYNGDSTHGYFGIVVNGNQGIGGQWYFIDGYQNADSSGFITLPDHNNGVGDPNPNNVGQSTGSTATQIYINRYDSNGNDYIEDLFKLAGNSGTLTLTQGGNSVTYGFTEQTFEAGSNGSSDYTHQVYADWYYENSLQGSLTIISPASGDFNTTDPISISYTITSPSYSDTFTITSNNYMNYYGYGVTTNGTTSFTSPGTSFIGQQFLGITSDPTQGFKTALLNQMVNVYQSNGLTTHNGTGYMFNVTWGDSSTGVVYVGFRFYGYTNTNLNIATVYTGDNVWQTTGQDIYNNIMSDAGTFMFPATFQLIQPTLSDNTDWC